MGSLKERLERIRKYSKEASVSPLPAGETALSEPSVLEGTALSRMPGTPADGKSPRLAESEKVSPSGGVKENEEKKSPKMFPLPWEQWESLVWRQVVLRKGDDNSPLLKESLSPWPVLLWQSLPGVALEGRGGETIGIGDFCFFDLETTGLSGGAGTVIFLAALGDVLSDGSLRITQYLLEDFPGEYAFLEAVQEELAQRQREGKILVTYNGMRFDLPLLRSRGIIHRLVFPELHHIDLLYPARLLWKQPHGPCSLVALEERVLQRPRESDIPGELAPLYWFHFLKTGDASGLVRVATHNQYDVESLYYLSCRVGCILSDPLRALETEAGDIEALARRWYGRYVKRKLSFSPGEGLFEEKARSVLENKNLSAPAKAPPGDGATPGEGKQFFYHMVQNLSRRIVVKGNSRFPLYWSAFFLRQGEVGWAREVVVKAVAKLEDPRYRYRCYRALAIIDEWYRWDYSSALEWITRMEELVATFPAAFPVPAGEYERIQQELLQRKKRVQKKSVAL
ncbi:MAG TPA: ribonuclease H-like domain-containing protein [Termitinemataceae bacterium]|nr:ribonuclease H-like domain-containing protein [Termitinemataceae bacterium]HOM22598.1 ribonuclease H-like domain-containing protein [Termitinemataceae bacterium]HPQ00046.1 ribonuclease H-like domain-containing protein [Termitinemataceae bacterium]